MFYHGLDFEGRDFKTGSIEIKHVNKKPVLFIKPFKMKPVEVTPKLMSPHQIEGAAKEFVSSLQNLKLKLHGGAEENPPNMNSGDIIAKLLPTHPMSIGKMSPKLESIGTLKADTEPNEPFKFKILEEKAPTLAKGDVLKAVLAEGKTVGLLMDMKLKPLPPKLGVDDIIAAAQEIQTQISEVDDHIKMHVAEHDPDPTQLEQIKPAPLNINYAMQLAALTLADESDTPIEHPFKIAPEAIDAKTIGVTKESFQKLDKQTVATIVPLLLAPQGAESSKYAPTNVEWYYRYTSHREDVYGPFSRQKMKGWYSKLSLKNYHVECAVGQRGEFHSIDLLGRGAFEDDSFYAKQFGSKRWSYKGTGGKIFGPFPDTQMQKWYTNNKLPATTLIAALGINPPVFAPLIAFGNASPFTPHSLKPLPHNPKVRQSGGVGAQGRHGRLALNALGNLRQGSGGGDQPHGGRTSPLTLKPLPHNPKVRQSGGVGAQGRHGRLALNALGNFRQGSGGGDQPHGGRTSPLTLKPLPHNPKVRQSGGVGAQGRHGRLALNALGNLGQGSGGGDQPHGGRTSPLTLKPLPHNPKVWQSGGVGAQGRHGRLALNALGNLRQGSGGGDQSHGGRTSPLTLKPLPHNPKVRQSDGVGAQGRHGRLALNALGNLRHSDDGIRPLNTETFPYSPKPDKQGVSHRRDVEDPVQPDPRTQTQPSSPSPVAPPPKLTCNGACKKLKDLAEDFLLDECAQWIYTGSHDPFHRRFKSGVHDMSENPRADGSPPNCECKCSKQCKHDSIRVNVTQQYCMCASRAVILEIPEHHPCKRLKDTIVKPIPPDVRKTTGRHIDPPLPPSSRGSLRRPRNSPMLLQPLKGDANPSELGLASTVALRHLKDDSRPSSSSAIRHEVRPKDSARPSPSSGAHRAVHRGDSSRLLPSQRLEPDKMGRAQLEEGAGLVNSDDAAEADKTPSISTSVKNLVLAGKAVEKEVPSAIKPETTKKVQQIQARQQKKKQEKQREASRRQQAEQAEQREARREARWEEYRQCDINCAQKPGWRVPCTNQCVLCTNSASIRERTGVCAGRYNECVCKKKPHR